LRRTSFQQFVVFLRLDQNRQISIRFFPQREKVLVSAAIPGRIARERRRSSHSYLCKLGQEDLAKAGNLKILRLSELSKA
jgi:hypothetical protein